MPRNQYLTLDPDQWALTPDQWGEGTPAHPDGRLQLQLAEAGPEEDGWRVVVCGWVYTPDEPGPQSATGVWVAADVLDTNG